MAHAVLAPEHLPSWVTLVRAPNPGPLTLDGTNSWVLRLPGPGTLVVDPGPLDEQHLATLASLGPVDGILLTHGHADHAEGLPRLQELTGAPLIAQAPGVTRLPTPGHTADSICFLVSGPERPVVLTGDTVLGKGTSVVAYPDGDLADYLASLDMLSSLGTPAGLGPLAGLGPVPVLPGHGPALADCAATAAGYLAHRRARLAQVREAIAAGARTPAAIVAAVYPGVNGPLGLAAELSVRAQIAFLAQDPAFPAEEPGAAADFLEQESAAGVARLDKP
jgi:glyoxylase-like metal-dependent hydrolase (beta-lactamase superfamily II)